MPTVTIKTDFEEEFERKVAERNIRDINDLKIQLTELLIYIKSIKQK